MTTTECQVEKDANLCEKDVDDLCTSGSVIKLIKSPTMHGKEKRGVGPEPHRTIRLESEENEDYPNHLSPTNPYPVPLLTQPLM